MDKPWKHFTNKDLYSPRRNWGLGSGTCWTTKWHDARTRQRTQRASSVSLLLVPTTSTQGPAGLYPRSFALFIQSLPWYFCPTSGINHRGFLLHVLQKAEKQIWISTLNCCLRFNRLSFWKRAGQSSNPCILLSPVQFVFKSLFYFLFQCHMLLCQHNTGSS